MSKRKGRGSGKKITSTRYDELFYDTIRGFETPPESNHSNTARKMKGSSLVSPIRFNGSLLSSFEDVEDSMQNRKLFSWEKNWKDDKGNDNISPLCVSMNAAIEELLSDDNDEEEGSASTSSIKSIIQEMGDSGTNVTDMDYLPPSSCHSHCYSRHHLHDNDNHPHEWKKKVPADVLKWINLREQYLNHINDLIVSEESNSTKSEEDFKKLKFTLTALIPAIRKVTKIIVQNYMDTGNEYMKGYIGKMASDLNFISRTSFAAWINVDVVNNTFLIPYSIDGVHLCQHKDKIPVELVVNDDEIEILKELGNVIWKVFSEYSAENRGKSSGICHEMNIVARDEHHTVNKQFSIIGQAYGMKENRLHEAARGGERHYFHLWWRVIDCEKKIASLQEVINKRILRGILQVLQVLTWQSANFRRLQQARISRFMKEVMEAWKDYSLWCRRFNRLRKNADRRAVWYCMGKMKLYCHEFTSNRQYKYSRRLYLKREAFQALVHNLVLSQFDLKNRLKLGTEKNLFERNMLKLLFMTWKQYPYFQRRIMILNDLIAFGLKKTGFRALYKNTWSHWPEDDVSRMNTKEKLRVASMKIVSFTRAVRIKGEEFLKKSSEEGRRLRDEVVEKSMDMLKKTPGIKGILLLTKKARDLRRLRFDSMRSQRMEVIRVNKFRSGIDHELLDFTGNNHHCDPDTHY